MVIVETKTTTNNDSLGLGPGCEVTYSDSAIMSDLQSADCRFTRIFFLKISFLNGKE
jgi:hypothetical protein